jgi:large subunit ribosomal protein L3
MVDIQKPRRGSMAFRPRQRAKSQNAEVNWQPHPDKRVLGFAGYKVGMTHLSYLDQTNSPTKGQVVSSAATILEVPPLVVFGVRCYQKGNAGMDILTSEASILKRLGIKKPQTPKEPAPDSITRVHILAFAQPNKTQIGKKHIECMEVGIGGKDATEKLDYAKSLLGKEIRIGDVFKPGEFVDAVGITKGKGWQGAVKRFGVAQQRRKATNKRRHVGSLGQWHPAYVLYTIPQAGQTGYHKRTEFNKQVLKTGTNVEEINPNGGFLHYGFIRNDYILIKGSLPGPYKRLIKLRLGIRAPTQINEPKISYIALPGESS